MRVNATDIVIKYRGDVIYLMKSQNTLLIPDDIANNSDLSVDEVDNVVNHNINESAIQSLPDDLLDLLDDKGYLKL